MQIVNLKQFKKTDRYKKIMNRGKENYEDIFGLVQDIMKDVRKNGDKAVKKYTERFDKLNIQDTKVVGTDFDSFMVNIENNEWYT